MPNGYRTMFCSDGGIVCCRCSKWEVADYFLICEQCQEDEKRRLKAQYRRAQQLHRWIGRGMLPVSVCLVIDSFANDL